MSKKSNFKNYIITFSDESISHAKLAGLLGINKSKVVDAVTGMNEAYEPDSGDTFHYGHTGSNGSFRP